MAHVLDLVRKSAGEGAHAKCLQKALSEEEERPAKKLRLGERKGREKRKKKELKHKGDGDI